MRYWKWLLLSFLAVFAVAALFAREIGLAVAAKVIHVQFADVPEMTPAEIDTWLSNKKQPTPVLLDVRSQREFQVSHLPGARRVTPGMVPKLDVPKSTPIVTYCSVGYRSAGCARALRAMGFKHVWNMEGSIFEWAKEGRPLVDATGASTTKVHPYNRYWGWLLTGRNTAEVR